MVSLSHVSLSQSLLILQGWHQNSPLNQKAGQIIERYFTQSRFLMVSLCVKMDFPSHVWTLCAASALYLPQYQRELSVRCPSAGTEMTLPGYSLKIFLSDSLLCSIYFIVCMSVWALFTGFDGLLLLIISFSVTQEWDLFSAMLSHRGHFYRHLGNCYELVNKRKTFW